MHPNLRRVSFRRPNDEVNSIFNYDFKGIILERSYHLLQGLLWDYKVLQFMA